MRDGRRIDFDCRCTNGDGDVLVDGIATVAAPAQRIAYTDIATPEVVLRRNDGFARLFKRCEGLAPVTVRGRASVRPRLAGRRDRGGASAG